MLAKIGIPGAGIIGICFLIYPPLGFLAIALVAAAIGLALSVYAFWLWLCLSPLLIFAWLSWDAITAFGFLGYWGILGLIVLPIFFLMDKAADSSEYLFTGMSTLIWLAIGSLYILIAYWDVAQWVLGVSFFAGGAYVLIDTFKGGTENA